MTISLFKIPDNLSPERRRMVRDVNSVLVVCVVQFALMVCVSIYFTSSEQGPTIFYRELAAFKNVIPIVSRLHSIFDKPDQNVEFHRLFAIYLSYAAIQFIFFLILAGRLWPSIFFRRTGAKHRLGFWVGVTACLLTYYYVFVGRDLGSPTFGKWAHRLVDGDYTISIVHSFLVPAANFFLYVLIIGRYGKDASASAEPEK